MGERFGNLLSSEGSFTNVTDVRAFAVCSLVSAQMLLSDKALAAMAGVAGTVFHGDRGHRTAVG